MKLLPLLLIIFFFTAFSHHTINNLSSSVYNDTLHYLGEIHFKNIQQLTFGGDIWGRPTGRLILCPMAILFFAATMSIKEVFLLICIP